MDAKTLIEIARADAADYHGESPELAEQIESAWPAVEKAARLLPCGSLVEVCIVMRQLALIVQHDDRAFEADRDSRNAASRVVGIEATIDYSRAHLSKATLGRIVVTREGMRKNNPARSEWLDAVLAGTD